MGVCVALRMICIFYQRGFLSFNNINQLNVINDDKLI